MVDGNFLREDNVVPAGQDIVIALLERCFLWSDIVLTRYGNIRIDCQQKFVADAETRQDKAK